ncbi:CAAX amino terminal protease family protein [Bifidobacterium dolichotidis]|uniref:CAAX amino terminal protease family protein n=1 Tax=Bifidobacterium dolichotidis TaxID=2306976 RepID=A0A430FQK3_9BIFI|nr:CPBP family intramembrane glutamic endopeptidase [Bifidobacterium dolichotidis]RSX55122.1 CAAX amino terminal protease family protein [Bifidobacterium dolichotidis]
MTTSQRLQRARRGAQYGGDPPSLDAVARRMRIKTAQIGVSKVSFGVLLFCVLMQTGVTLGMIIGKISGVPTAMLTSPAVGIIFQDVIMVALLPLAVLAMRSVQPVAVPRSLVHASQFLRYALMILPISFLFDTVRQFVIGVVPNYNVQNPLTSMSRSSVLVTIFASVIVGPIIEEWIYRKQVISRLRRFGETPAILASAALFSLMHGNINQVLDTFCAGLILGYIYVRTNNLLCVIALHMINNLNSVVGGYAEPYIKSFNGSFAAYASITYYLLIALATAAGFVLLALNIRKVVLHHDAPEQIPQHTVGRVVFGNVGMILFVIFSVLLMLTSLTQT